MGSGGGHSWGYRSECVHYPRRRRPGGGTAVRGSLLWAGGSTPSHRALSAFSSKMTRGALGPQATLCSTRAGAVLAYGPVPTSVSLQPVGSRSGGAQLSGVFLLLFVIANISSDTCDPGYNPSPESLENLIFSLRKNSERRA